MTKKDIGKNSSCSKKSKEETLQKERIKNNMEYTGVLEKITKKDDITAKPEKK